MITLALNNDKFYFMQDCTGTLIAAFLHADNDYDRFNEGFVIASRNVDIKVGQTVTRYINEERWEDMPSLPKWAKHLESVHFNRKSIYTIDRDSVNNAIDKDRMLKEYKRLLKIAIIAELTEKLIKDHVTVAESTDEKGNLLLEARCNIDIISKE